MTTPGKPDEGNASARYARDLITYARAWTSARDRYAADPGSNPHPSTLKIRLPPSPLSVKPTRDQCDGGSSPPLDLRLSRRQQIAAYASFVEAEGHNLVNHASQPLFCVQQAYDSAASGPVHDKARKIIEKANGAMALLCRSSSLLPFNPNPALLPTLGGHEGVRAVCVTPDGRIALSGGGKVLLIWDVESGRWTRELRVDTPADITAVWLSPDGCVAVTGSHARVAIPGLVTLRVWDLENGRCLRAISGPHIGGISVTADCRKVVFVESGLGYLWICDLEKDETVRQIGGEKDYADSVCVTPEGRVAVSEERRNLDVWDVETGERRASLEGHLGTLIGHSGEVQSVSLTPDGHIAVSGGMDKTLRVWDLETHECVRVIEVDTEWNMAIHDAIGLWTARDNPSPKKAEYRRYHRSKSIKNGDDQR